jgi:hypothetical protein
MEGWTVHKYVKLNGRCPIDEWCQSNAVTEADLAALDARVDTIEGISGSLPPEFLKKYKGDIKELKVRANKKQLRPLCAVCPERKIVLLCGAIEKGGKIPKGDIRRALGLLRDFKSGEGSVKHYHED